jgi:hypothetical protein
MTARIPTTVEKRPKHDASDLLIDTVQQLLTTMTEGLLIIAHALPLNLEDRFNVNIVK